jgi:ubiquinone/menaquinone biosynthesis C-methylase UbiE
MANYKKALQIDGTESVDYYTFSLNSKTEQQKMLEELLSARGIEAQRIADIACGGGGTSLHLSKRFGAASFTLMDVNEDALDIARREMAHTDVTCLIGDIYDIGLASDSYDLVICWQTLSWIENPERALHELVRICSPGGRVFASSLFNLHHDVDIYSKVIDHSRASSREGLFYSYNTYSRYSVSRWLAGLSLDFEIHEFSIPLDLVSSGRGLGTYTIKTDYNERLQVSAGMLLNWGILEIVK